MDFYFPTTLSGELELDYSVGQNLAISQNNDNQGLFGTTKGGNMAVFPKSGWLADGACPANKRI